MRVSESRDVGENHNSFASSSNNFSRMFIKIVGFFFSSPFSLKSNSFTFRSEIKMRTSKAVAHAQWCLLN